MPRGTHSPPRGREQDSGGVGGSLGCWERGTGGMANDRGLTQSSLDNGWQEGTQPFGVQPEVRAFMTGTPQEGNLNPWRAEGRG